jgi:4-diphosphocytidyl-2-C-methyl-D-erythritol kinase
VEMLRLGHTGLAGKLLHNGLQPAAERLSNWIGRLKAEFARLDVLGHQMSGSGTSYFGLCRDARQARRVARQMEVRGVGSVYAVRSCF